MEIDFSLLQLAIIGFFSGLGATFGGELAKALINHMRKSRRYLETIPGLKQEKKVVN